MIFDANLRLHRWPAPARAASVAREFVPGAFLVKANAEEARLLTGERDPALAAESLLAAGARHALITRGADGALLRGEGQPLEVPGVAAAAVDTTGAGDTFSGVVLAAPGRDRLLPARDRRRARRGGRGRGARDRALGRDRP